jgi:exo-1,4-beta-D-glucosaminidase
LAGGWRLASASTAQADGSTISAAGFSDFGWYPIHRMPATVLQILQEDGVYTDL